MLTRTTKAGIAALTLLALLGACGGGDKNKDDGGTGGESDDAATAASCTPQSGTDLALEEVVSGLSSPIFLTAPQGDPRLFVVEQSGAIKIIENGQVSGTFLDIGDRIYDVGGEQGLLGLAFHPNYPEDPRFFVDYTADNPEGGQNDPYKTVIAEFRVSEDDPNDADESSEQVLLEIDQFASNHNGGMVAFGPDGHLYVAMGDGGGGGDNDDPDKPEGHGQDRNTLLGALLRLDVSTPGEAGIPEDNPYADGQEGAPEVWAYGLRNPWRFSFDRATGDLYIGDVGQGDWEEVNFLAAGTGAGSNFGWRLMEGTHCFNPGSGCESDELVLPVTDYSHNAPDYTGESITGGYVYRGACLPDIQGWYFYADYEDNKIYKLEMSGGEATAIEDLTPQLSPGGGLSSFGQDAAGELYVLSHGPGRVSRIVAGP